MRTNIGMNVAEQQQLVGERIEQPAEIGLLLARAREVAVDVVA